jgi:hypothetical protein
MLNSERVKKREGDFSRSHTCTLCIQRRKLTFLFVVFLLDVFATIGVCVVSNMIVCVVRVSWTLGTLPPDVETISKETIFKRVFPFPVDLFKSCLNQLRKFQAD